MRNDFMSNMENELLRKGDVIKLIEDVHKDKIKLSDLSQYIIAMPAAYSIDSVIESLLKDIEPNLDSDTGEHCNNWVIDMVNELTERHIQIVRMGMKK